MRYSIEGFSQEFAITLKKTVTKGNKIIVRQIDCTDLVILRWFVDFYPEMVKIEIDGKQYAMLTHKKLLEDLPIIDISKKSFIERMQKLVEFDILTYKLLKQGGTYSLYSFGNNYKNLISHNNNEKSSESEGYPFKRTRGIRSNGLGVSVQTDNKDKSIINSSINNSILDTKVSCSFDTIGGNKVEIILPKIDIDKEIEGNTPPQKSVDTTNEIEELFERVWELYPKKTNKTQIRQATKKKLFKVGYEKLTRCIERYKKELEANKTAYQFIKAGSTFFNGGYEDYIADDWQLPTNEYQGKQRTEMKKKLISKYDRRE